MELYSRGIIGGVGGNMFMPNANITRAQFVKILAGLAKADLSSYQSTMFNDVKNTDWFMKPVAWAYEKGIVNGLTDGSFAPNAPITREDMAVMLYRFVTNVEQKTLAGTNNASFTDMNKVSAYAVSAVEVMAKAGIITGKPGNIFDPKAFSTRAEACKMIYELIRVSGI